MTLNGKKITIVGFAKSAIALAELVLKLEGKPKISEQAQCQKKEELLDGWPLRDKVVFEFAGHTPAFISDSDCIVLSPGVRIDAQLVQWAREKQIPVVGEIEFAYQYCRAPIVAITGSNGKTTVSTLIHNVLSAYGKKAYLCGNIGTPFSKYALEAKQDDVVVMETSSFQLESIDRFKPHVAVFLNFSQNHLDRHKDCDEYFDAKKRIFMNQTSDDFAVLNYKDSRIRELGKDMEAKVVFFNKATQESKNLNPNHSAVFAISQIFEIPRKTTEKVLSEFKGVEHRMEWVRAIDGVDFINDSKSTTAESGRWALTSMSKPVIMICGGRDKNIDFHPLKELVAQKVKALVLIGEAKNKLRATFGSVAKTVDCSSLEEAVQKAHAMAESGDCVILSPMCASFDMFLNFEERGKNFKEIVSRL